MRPRKMSIPTMKKRLHKHAPAKKRRSRASSVELDCVPDASGRAICGRHARGEVIYVGKAEQLRARMRQYVNFQDDRAKIPLARRADLHSFEYIVVGNEHESLVLGARASSISTPPGSTPTSRTTSPTRSSPSPRGDAVPCHQVHAREASSRHALLRPLSPIAAPLARMVDVASAGSCRLCSTSSCADWRALQRRTGKGPARPAWPPTFARASIAHVGLGPGACCGRRSRPEEYAAQRQAGSSSLPLRATIGEFVGGA